MNTRRRQAHSPQAYTLVELMVVIAIIGVLASLLVPAIQASRERARQAQCANRLKQLSTAMLNRVTSSHHAKFPGYIERLRLDQPAPTNLLPDPYFKDWDNQTIQASWAAMLLPYLDSQALADQMRSGKSFDYENPPEVETFVCPSNISANTERGALTYIANTGAEDGDCASTDDRANGLFHNLVNFDTAVRFPNDLPDGSASTLMFSENSHKNIEAASWLTWTEPVAREHTYVEQVFGMIWLPTLNSPAPAEQERINRDTTKRGVYSYADSVEPVTGARFARPASNHPEIVLASFVDGNVRSLRETIEYTVYQRLMTTDGNHSVETLSSDPDIKDVMDSIRQLPPLSDEDY